MLTPADATAAIAAQITPFPTIPVALRDATGCVLKQTVVAERDQPPFDRVAMDGIAITSNTSLREFRIAGIQAAGTPPLSLANEADCFEAMTGAVLPHGCDCVVPVERIKIDNGRARLSDEVVLTPWLNLHRRGSDSLARTELLHAGIRLGPPEIAVLASAGIAHVKVARPPRIVVISTGNELVEPQAPIADWQIRRSNVYAVLASLRAYGYLHVSDDHIADDERELKLRLGRHLKEADVLILSGGVSMGKFDFVPRILGELKVRQVFHKIAQRPGKPMWFGAVDGKTVYALPGNPVSTLACLARYVLPGLRFAAGLDDGAETLALAENCNAIPALATLLPVRKEKEQNGDLRARPMLTKGSGDFVSLIGADGCIELSAGTEAVKAGTLVKFYRW